MSGKYALIIGNTEYIDPGLAQLTAPGKDAEDFARILKDPEICAFDQVNILLNQLSSTVIEGIDEFFDQKKPDDLLVLYFSGHGVRDELGSLYLAVRNTIRFRLRSTAIRSDFIREAMDQSRSKRQVLILDCCNSGAFSQGTKAATGVSIGTASAFEVGYGRIILTASDSTQFAWEGDKVIGETDNSLFTHFLVHGLEGEADLDGDGNITVDELYDYAYDKVKFATPKQTPSKFSSKQQGEIVLRQITRVEDIKPVTLPDQLVSEIENPYPEVRLRAVLQLAKLLSGKNLGLARSAREALERIEKEDDSRTVSRATFQALEAVRQAEQVALQKTEEERLAAEQEAKQETERLLAEQRADEERLAKAKLEAGQLAEEKRRGDEKPGAEPKAKEEAERLLAENKVRKEKSTKPIRITSQPYFLPIVVTALIIVLASSIGGYYMRQNIPQGSIPTSSATKQPTITNTTTPTKRPGQTLQPSSIPKVESYVYINVSQASMYQGPGLGYYLVNQAIYSRGEKLTVIARNSSGLWLLVQASDGTTGWLYKDWIELSFDPLEIPTASFIPTVVPTSTRKPKGPKATVCAIGIDGVEHCN